MIISLNVHTVQLDVTESRGQRDRVVREDDEVIRVKNELIRQLQVSRYNILLWCIWFMGIFTSHGCLSCVVLCVYYSLLYIHNYIITMVICRWIWLTGWLQPYFHTL